VALEPRVESGFWSECMQNGCCADDFGGPQVSEGVAEWKSVYPGRTRDFVQKISSAPDVSDQRAGLVLTWTNGVDVEPKEALPQRFVPCNAGVNFQA